MGCNARKDIMKCQRTRSCDGCFQDCGPKLLNACEIALLALTHEPINPDDVEFIKTTISEIKEQNPAEELAGININKAPIHINHSELERDGDFPFRSTCPVCKVGLLLVERNIETLELLEQDRCILCGQLVIYDDIDKMRNEMT